VQLESGKWELASCASRQWQVASALAEALEALGLHLGGPLSELSGGVGGPAARLETETKHNSRRDYINKAGGQAGWLVGAAELRAVAEWRLATTGTTGTNGRQRQAAARRRQDRVRSDMGINDNSQPASSSGKRRQELAEERAFVVDVVVVVVVVFCEQKAEERQARARKTSAAAQATSRHAEPAGPEKRRSRV